MTGANRLSQMYDKRQHNLNDAMWMRLPLMFARKPTTSVMNERKCFKITHSNRMYPIDSVVWFVVVAVVNLVSADLGGRLVHE